MMTSSSISASASRLSRYSCPPTPTTRSSAAFPPSKRITKLSRRNEPVEAASTVSRAWITPRSSLTPTPNRLATRGVALTSPHE